MGHGMVIVLSDVKGFKVDEDRAWDIMEHAESIDYFRNPSESEMKDYMRSADEELQDWFDKDGDAYILNEDKLDEFCDEVMESALDGNREFIGASGLLRLRYLLSDAYSSSPIIIHKNGRTTGSTRTLVTVHDTIDSDDRLYLTDVLDYHE